MLASDQALDHASDQSLLLNVDQWLKLHRRWKRNKSREHLGMSGSLESVGHRVYAYRLVGGSWVNQVGKLAVSVELRKIDSYEKMGKS